MWFLYLQLSEQGQCKMFLAAVYLWFVLWESHAIQNVIIRAIFAISAFISNLPQHLWKF